MLKLMVELPELADRMMQDATSLRSKKDMHDARLRAVEGVAANGRQLAMHKARVCLPPTPHPPFAQHQHQHQRAATALGCADRSVALQCAVARAGLPAGHLASGPG